jgi:outer membrane lipoprotein-sorting protein
MSSARDVAPRQNRLEYQLRFWVFPEHNGKVLEKTEMTQRRISLTILVLGMAATACAQATLESVEKSLIDKMNKLSSWAGKATAVTDTPQMKSNSEMTIEAMKKGDQWLYRTDGKTQMKMKIGEKEETQNTPTSVVYDGEYIYTLTENAGQKMAMKMKPTTSGGFIVDKQVFETLAKDHNLKLLPDETVAGKKCWVIEATPKKAPPGGAMVSLTYYDQESGFPIQTIVKGPDGKVMTTSKLTDVKLNPKLSADRFVFKAPEGVQVVDMSSLGQPAEPKGGEEPKAEPAKEQPKEQPKAEPKPEKPKTPKLPKLPK